MRRRVWFGSLLFLALVLSFARDVRGQTSGLGERGPRFLAVPLGGGKPVDASRAAIFQRRVSLQLTHVTARTALERMSRAANLRLVFSDDLVRLDRFVSLDARDLTIAAVLTELLIGTDIDVLLMRDGQLGLVRKSENAGSVFAPGAVAGRVTDGKTGDPIVGAEVWVEGNRQRAVTGEKGFYKLADIPQGNYTLAVRRVGYLKQSRAVTVAADAETTVDFALQPVVTQLDELVTTVTGDRRARELGHVIGRINADSLVKETPVTNISQLLTGRVPGLQVFQSSGIVGGDVQLQVRTPNSLLLGTQPIVIVDGVRYTNTAANDPARNSDPTYNVTNPPIYGRSVSRGPAAGAEVTSPLNDLNLNDIENIEVVKGPTAATLYGTDAANGVILITTKHGRAGPARWEAYAKGARAETPNNRLPAQTWAWGSWLPYGTPFGTTTNDGRFRPFNCTLVLVAGETCVQDSVTTFDPFGDPALSIFKSAPQWMYGLNVSGGTTGLRYYVGGSLQQETGSIQMPKAFLDSLEAARGGPLPKEQLRPNALSDVNLRSNVNVSTKTMQLQGNLGYVRRRNRTLDNAVYSALGSFNSNPTMPWGTADQSADGQSANSPDELFARTSINTVDRFITGVSGDWRLLPWLQARAGAGVDLTEGLTNSLMRRGETRDYIGRPAQGWVQEEVTRQRGTSADVGLTATVARGRLSSRTSFGAQYNRSLNEIRIAEGRGLVPGGESVVQADDRTTDRVFSETATLGSYAEQMVGLNDRFFVTAALRVDGASNFGQQYEAATYPKVSVSWLVSDEPFMPRLPGVDELRLRYAYGATGQQAYTWMKLPSFTTPQGTVEGSQTALVNVNALGNERLRPERASEHEFGFDLTALESRVTLGLAWYRRRVADQIMRQTLPPGLGEIYTNLGLTTARGFEATLVARILENRRISWDVSVNHASSSTLLVDVGSAGQWISDLGSLREGYSLGARFQYRYLGFADANGDGIIVPSELQWSDSAYYVGETIPPHTQSLHTTLGFFGRRLRVSASFNRSTGHLRTRNPSPCANGACRALLDPNTPLAEQALALSKEPIPGYPSHHAATSISADETRFSALSITAELPASMLSRLGVRTGMVTVAASNLALWTSYPGDPSSVQTMGVTTSRTAGVPQARSWTFRFDLGL